MNLSSELEKLTDTTYLKTNKTTIPTNWPMLGVRIPEIKKLVQKIPKEEIPNYLETKPENHEEILARGFLITRLPYEEMLQKERSGFLRAQSKATPKIPKRIRNPNWLSLFTRLIHERRISINNLREY